MPPGYMLVVSCLLAVSLVNARKSERQSINNEWQVSNTMSREANEHYAPARYPDTIDIDNNQGYSMASDYPGSGYGQRHDEWGSGFTDDEDGYDDDFSGYRETEYPPAIPKPNKRPGAGSDSREDTFIVKPPKQERPFEESHDTDNGIIYDGPKQPEAEPDKPGIVIETVPEGDDDLTDDDDDENDDSSHSGEHLSRSIIQTPGLLPGIIGGAVVGLLCAVLLVMFIVYRMRKKDEGSYALEEPKMTSPSRGYTRAPTKEYWA